MNVEVHFTAQLRQALGRQCQNVSVPADTTVGQLLERLAREHEDAFQQFVLSPAGELLPNMIICVNDQQLTHPSEHSLRNGDSVTFLSAISGG